MKKKKNQSNVWFKEGVWNFFFLPFLYFSPRPTTKKSNLATTEEPIKVFFFVLFFPFLFLSFNESQRKVSAFSFQAVVREIWAPTPPTPEVLKCESGTQFGLLIKSLREKKSPAEQSSSGVIPVVLLPFQNILMERKITFQRALLSFFLKCARAKKKKKKV